MRKTYIVLTIIFLTFNGIANGQLNKRQKAFITSFLNEREPKKPVFYLSNHNDRALLEALKPDTLVDMWALAGRNKPQNKLILTQKERKHISTKLRQLRELKWKDRLLPGARLLHTDTVQYYLKDRALGWQRMYDRGISGFYTFSNPIFLRNETLCIFQYDFSCGSLCGDGTIMIYRKENGLWKPYINLANWVS
ncbi:MULTISPECIES: hypothetical protein [Pedobacter]|uniref:hypothetical protein n=1 Tax=Pedobacter TaxID=84567 RepID=UPI00210E64A8|nr:MULTISPECIES: hypothetical protein [unclassified Pedobacter]